MKKDIKKPNAYIVLLLSILLITAIALPFAAFSEDYPQLNLELINGSNGDVSSDLNLPSEVDGIDGTIVWTAADEELIAISDGTGKIMKYNTVVPQPTSVTAHLENGDTKQINFAVKYEADPSETVEVFSENFASSSYKGTVSRNVNFNVAASDGQLVASRVTPSEAAISELVYKFDETFSGKYVIEFNLTSTLTSGGVEFSLPTSSRTNQTVYMQIDSDKTVNIYDGTSKKSDVATLDSLENIAVKIFTDTQAQTFSLWLNGELAAENYGYRHSATQLTNMRIWTGKAVSIKGEVKLDNIKISAVADILGDITQGTLNYGSDEPDASVDLLLPAKTLSKYAISWQSENGYIIPEDGFGRLRGSDKEETEDTLTASTVINGVTYYRTYEFNLLVSTVPIPSGNLIFEENFNSANAETLISSGVLTTSATASVVDGKLQCVSASGNVNNNIYFGSHNATDSLVIEFDLKREADGNVLIHSLSSPKSTIINGHFRALFGKTTVSAVTEHRGAVSGDDNGTTVKDSCTLSERFAKVIVELKSDGTWSMWVDSEQLVNNQPRRMSDSLLTSSTTLNIRTVGSQTVTIDNIKVYESSERAKDTADNVLGKLASLDDIAPLDETTGEVIGDLIAPSDANGCTVSFSDSEALVSADGSLEFAPHTTPTDITISVTTPSGYTGTKTFAATVASNYILGTPTIEGLDSKGSYLIAELPVELRRAEKSDENIKAKLSVYDSSDEIASELSRAQTVIIGGKNYGIVGYIEDLSDIDMPDIPTVKLTLYSSTDNYSVPITELNVYGD